MQEQLLARTASKRKPMKDEFHSRLSKKASTYLSKGSIRILAITLDRMIRKYSEQLLCQPLEEMTFWFDYRSGSFLSPGYAPLYYKSTTPKEGVKLAQPIQDYPDVVMFTSDKTYLTEAQATTKLAGVIQSSIDTKLVDVIIYASVCKEKETPFTQCSRDR